MRIENIHTIVFDFDGIFTNNKVFVDSSSNEIVQCSRADGYAFDLFNTFLTKNNISLDYFILSKETNSVVLKRAKKLKIECHHSINNKLEFLNNYFLQKFPNLSDPFKGLAYLGNDLNDLPAMLKAGLSVAPSDAHQEIKKISHYVLPEKGGDGFVRAFIEKLINFENFTKEEKIELISNS